MFWSLHRILPTVHVRPSFIYMYSCGKKSWPFNSRKCYFYMIIEKTILITFINYKLKNNLQTALSKVKIHFSWLPGFSPVWAFNFMFMLEKLRYVPLSPHVMEYFSKYDLIHSKKSHIWFLIMLEMKDN